MAFCHGQGTTDPGGCCYVNGQVCQYHLDNTGLVAWINANLTGQRRNRALNFAQGIQHACLIAIRVLDANFSLVNDRAGFESAWNNHPDYVANVRPAWAALEQANGWPAGSYQCSSWKGGTPSQPGVRQCCFAEDTTTNEAKATALHSTAVTVRRAGGG